jgi:hypothetical protein
LRKAQIVKFWKILSNYLTIRISATFCQLIEPSPEAASLSDRTRKRSRLRFYRLSREN